MRESKEDFLTSHVQNFECTSIQNPVRGGVGENNIIGTILQKRTVLIHKTKLLTMCFLSSNCTKLS